ncbi:hypothetical protein [Gleimia europaea]|uniref:hypothetical protein n=1 Tax=Gleimia europaea TaxID=66228 RepID=UPI0012E9A279|nr:hypothetical protein [Gleimia europaea]
METLKTQYTGVDNLVDNLWINAVNAFEHAEKSPGNNSKHVKQWWISRGVFGLFTRVIGKTEWQW